MKNTLVVGASPNPDRYGYLAVERLNDFGHPVFAYGIRQGRIGEIGISSEWPCGQFHTVTLYINPRLQKEYYDRIINLRPERVIFNPGTENLEFQQRLAEQGIPFEESCTLVLLNIGKY